MREIRIHQAGEYELGTFVELSPEASQHVGTVLRMQPGALITLFCGNNKEYQALITEVRKKQVVVVIHCVSEVNRESSLTVHLAQAISKGDRMEWVVQKAVELGVASITPVLTERCVVKLVEDRFVKKIHQWQAIAIAACEQSGRNKVPEIRNPLKLKDYLALSASPLKFILDPEGKKSWRDYLFDHKIMDLLIGPEGGLTQEEVRLAVGHGFNPLSLGPRVLRTETAAMTALSVLQAICGDL